MTPVIWTSTVEATDAKGADLHRRDQLGYFEPSVARSLNRRGLCRVLSPSYLPTLDYRQLQSLCKQIGVSAKGDAGELVDRLEDELFGESGGGDDGDGSDKPDASDTEDSGVMGEADGPE